MMVNGTGRGKNEHLFHKYGCKRLQVVVRRQIAPAKHMKNFVLISCMEAAAKTATSQGL